MGIPKSGMRKKGLPFLFLFLLIGPCLWSQESPAVKAFTRGEEYLADGQIYEAIDFFQESLGFNPDYAKPLAGLAEAYFKLGEYEQAFIYVQKARKLARNDMQVAALEGRIYTGLGRYEEAEELFQRLLRRQPYHQELIFGLAELHVAQGNIENALNNYRTALESDPYNRRGLLSAALLYASQKRYDDAEELIQTAVDTYPEDAVVHSIASQYYLKSDLYEKAENHAWQAVTLDPEHEEALAVLIDVLFRQSRYLEASDAVERSIGLDRRNPLLWYLRGQAFWNLNQKQNALESFYTALDLRPSDEIARIGMEEFLLEEYEPESAERIQAAKIRFERGSAYERDNRIELARQEYRRGLMLHPYDREGRVLYANTYKRSENIGKYLSILEVLEIDNNTTSDIRDEIEIYRNLRSESIAREWDVDQFGIDRFRYRFALFTSAAESSLIHLQGETALSNYMRGLLQGFESIEIVEQSRVEAYSEAFKSARNNNADFFIMIAYQETQRSFRVQARVYNARTGAEIEQFGSIRTGNNRITQALVRTADGLADALPVRGTIYRRKGGDVLVDIGAFQGLEEDAILFVIRDEHLVLANTSFVFQFDEENLLGEVAVNEIDDLIAAGAVRTYQFFDLINPGDTVFPKPDEAEQDEQSTEEEQDEIPGENERSTVLSDIYSSILDID